MVAAKYVYITLQIRRWGEGEICIFVYTSRCATLWVSIKKILPYIGLSDCHMYLHMYFISVFWTEIHGKHCFVDMSLWTIFTVSFQVIGTSFCLWATVCAVINCDSFNLHTVCRELSFQGRAIPCQEFRMLREMVWFILFIAQSCGRWSSVRDLCQCRHESSLPLI